MALEGFGEGFSCKLGAVHVALLVEALHLLIGIGEAKPG